jgi:hypothetical protein
MLMATNRKYIAEFYDIEQVLHTVTIERPGEIDTEYLIQYSDHTAVELTHGGGSKDAWDTEVIQGQELVFKFWLPRADVDVLDGIFESAYHDYRLTYEINSVTEFIGWIKPENLTKRYEKNPPFIEISMSATDGLAELRHIEFRDLDDNERLIKGEYTILQLLKKALRYIDFELDFKVQLNTYEVINMTSTECVLKEVKAKADRFLKKVGEDEETVMTCWDVIHYLLIDFNVKFLQYKGYYYIIKYHEKDSYIFTFSYSDLSQTSRVASNLVKDISSYLYQPYIEQQKVHPLKSTLITYEDVDVGGDATGLDLESIASYSSTFTSIQYVNAEKPQYGFTLTQTNSSSGTLQLTSTFNVTLNADRQKEYLKFDFDYRIMSLVHAGGTPEMELMIEVLRPNGVWARPVIFPLYLTDLTLPGGGWISPALSNYLHESFEIVEDGAYNVRLTFQVKPNYGWEWTNISIQIKNIKVLKIIGGIQYPYNPVTVNTKREYYQVNIGGYQKLEVDVLFGDGGITNLGSFLVDSTTTLEWTPYGETINARIIDLYSRTVLLNRSKYKNYLRFSVNDRNHTIEPIQVLQIQGVDYVVNGWNKNYRSGLLEMDLIELVVGTTGDYDDYEEEVEAESGTVTYGGTIHPSDGQYQLNHKFTLGDVVRYDTNILEFVKAQANSVKNAKAIGIVSEVISDDLFKYISDDYVYKNQNLYTALDLEVGEYYFLSPDTPGAIVKSAQLEIGDIEQCIGYVTTKGLKIEIDARVAKVYGNNHNDLENKQGGTENDEGEGQQYYHLTLFQRDKIRDIREATVAEVLSASHTNLVYLAPWALRLLRVVAYNGKRSEYPVEYVFPTSVLHDAHDLDDELIIEPLQ